MGPSSQEHLVRGQQQQEKRLPALADPASRSGAASTATGASPRPLAPSAATVALTRCTNLPEISSTSCRSAPGSRSASPHLVCRNSSTRRLAAGAQPPQQQQQQQQGAAAVAAPGGLGLSCQQNHPSPYSLSAEVLTGSSSLRHARSLQQEASATPASRGSLPQPSSLRISTSGVQLLPLNSSAGSAPGSPTAAHGRGGATSSTALSTASRLSAMPLSLPTGSRSQPLPLDAAEAAARLLAAGATIYPKAASSSPFTSTCVSGNAPACEPADRVPSQGDGDACSDDDDDDSSDEEKESPMVRAMRAPAVDPQHLVSLMPLFNPEKVKRTFNAKAVYDYIVQSPGGWKLAVHARGPKQESEEAERAAAGGSGGAEASAAATEQQQGGGAGSSAASSPRSSGSGIDGEGAAPAEREMSDTWCFSRRRDWSEPAPADGRSIAEQLQAAEHAFLGLFHGEEDEPVVREDSCHLLPEGYGDDLRRPRLSDMGVVRGGLMPGAFCGRRLGPFSHNGAGPTQGRSRLQEVSTQEEPLLDEGLAGTEMSGTHAAAVDNLKAGLAGLRRVDLERFKDPTFRHSMRRARDVTDLARVAHQGDPRFSNWKPSSSKAQAKATGSKELPPVITTGASTLPGNLASVGIKQLASAAQKAHASAAGSSTTYSSLTQEKVATAKAAYLALAVGPQKESWATSYERARHKAHKVIATVQGLPLSLDDHKRIVGSGHTYSGD